MSRMFKGPDGKPMTTWPIFVGCLYNCTYCNAKKTAETRLKHLPRYSDGFSPRLVPTEFRRRFKPGQFIFVTYMGDISFAMREHIIGILGRIKESTLTSFLLQSKNPKRFHDWRDNWGIILPPNIFLGTTIETNRDYGLSKAPPPVERFRYLCGYPHNHKFLSIEPIMDFDLEEICHWVKLLQPDIIQVGADNYHNHLPEPPWWKVERLLQTLRSTPDFLGKYPLVVEKEGLKRLKEG